MRTTIRLALVIALTKFSRSITRWWWGFATQTRLLTAAAVVIAIFISGFIYSTFTFIQQDARQSDRRFGDTIGNLLAAYAAPLIQANNIAGLENFTETFRRNPNIKYIIYLDVKGKILEGSPFMRGNINRQALLPRRVEVPQNIPDIREHTGPLGGLITDIFYPITYNNKRIGTVMLGINPDATLAGSSRLAAEVTVITGLSFGVLLLLAAVFNALTITQPLKEVVAGVRGISERNFQQRITLGFGGELDELVRSFNTMADRLQDYEAQNIEQITAEKARLETLITTIADGAILLSNHLKIMHLNPAAERILQWSSDVLGNNLLDRLPVGLRAEVEDSLVRVASGELEQAECRVLLDRPRRTLRVLMSPVLTGNDIGGVVLTVQDISREAELNEAKSRFISNVSHELRTPLFCIKSFIETLRDYHDVLEEDVKREFLETTNRETDRLTRLVNDVLDLSRLESGREYALEPIDLIQPIEQTLRTHQLSGQEKNITLTKRIDPSLPLVMGNYDLLNQLIANLVGNALKFTPEGGLVEIGAHCIDQDDLQKVRLSIRDTGIGIAPEDQEKIFDRFFRVENRVHTLQGTGLGLSIVNNIAEKHHTRVNLISEPGNGTTFWLDLEPYTETCALR
ncbi:HAMP domain-containing sensor histidine kinase [Anthocerotibacter panamensis]|uniref:HAMP domain-containing sensor histidine kinase n=1 Tax=Anthocerotibacter panamensis TaxID=2857077 RepID=UPI001C408BA8|nr:ATP-binding protein [Anthocerotibacter panamensis]